MKTLVNKHSLSLTSSSQEQTERVARTIAPLLVKGDYVMLSGDLGMGKSVFARALILSLIGEETDVPSPTYTLVQEYEGLHFPVRHYDLYRLEQPEDVHELGWDDNSAYLSIVEWPEKAGYLAPRDAWKIELSEAPQGRRIVITLPTNMEEEIPALAESLSEGSVDV